MLVQQHDLTVRVDSVTVNLRPYVRTVVRKMAEANPENGEILCDFINAELVERNIPEATRAWKLQVLTRLSAYFKHAKSFRSMTKKDLLLYLNSLRKTVEQDAGQRWIGNYNNKVLVFTKFFRWLYRPNEPDYKKRKTPPCMSGIKQLPKKTQTPYKPSDLWTPAEHDVFLKYCPLKRDRCYHAMARDTSARPHELLKLSICDIQFKIDQTTGRQYAEIVVSGKTKTRTLPLIDSIPYVKEWLSDHLERDNPEAPLFITLAVSNRGSRQTVNSLGKQYKAQYHDLVFPKLLSRPSLPEHDKEVIRGMLKKPWNLYVFRHSAIMEKAQILKEATLRDHAGWTMTSKMPAIYIHFFGAESSKSLLEARGIISKDKKEDNILQSKICPHCHEPNTSHSKFCLQCKMVLTYDGYTEAAGHQKAVEAELEELRTKIMDRDYHDRALQEAAYGQYMAEQKVEQMKGFLLEIAKKTGVQIPRELQGD